MISSERAEYGKLYLNSQRREVIRSFFLNVFCTSVWGLNNYMTPSWVDSLCVILFGILSLLQIIYYVYLGKELKVVGKSILAKKLMK
jgi:hypothetical protein